MTIRTRFLQWKGRKRDNRGSSMSIVLIVLTLLMILVSVMMSVTVVNYQMKTTNRNVQENFYSAESSLAEIRLGLAEDASIASNDAYSKVLERFNQYTSDERENQYWTLFLNKFRAESQISANSNNNDYSVSYIQGLLKECPYDSAKNVGARILTDDTAGQNIVSLDEAKRTITLKNIIVAFYDVQGFMTQIQTDIVIKCPPMDFSMVSSMPTLQNYVLVADESLDVAANTTTTVKGDAFVGTTVMGLGSTLNFAKADETKGRGLLVLGNDLKVDGQKLTVSDMEVWTTNLVVNGGNVETDDQTAMYISNDVLLNNQTDNGTTSIPNVVLRGELYAYGNVESAMTAYKELYGMKDSTDEEKKNNPIIQDPAQYSSSLIVNAHGMENDTKNATLNLGGLSVLKVSGNTYVSHRGSATGLASTSTLVDLVKNDVLMGESIASRTSQIAYLIPADCIAPGTVNGGINPMPLSRYEALIAELGKLKDDGDTSGKIPAGYKKGDMVIDYTNPSEILGNVSLNSLGVTGYQMEAHQLVRVGSMIYFFCKFNSDTAAQEYYKHYYAQQGGTRLAGYLDTTKVNIALPSDLLDMLDPKTGELKNPTQGLKFYLNGTVLAGSGNSKVLINSDFNSPLITADLAANRAEEVTYHKNYAALRYKLAGGYNNTTAGDLNNYYGALSPEDKNKLLSGGASLTLAPYKSLVNNLTNSDILYYVSADDGYTAVVVNNSTNGGSRVPFVIDSTLDGTIQGQKDKNGATHSDAKLRVVIASGDVVVSKDFSGVILAGGKVSVTNTATITSESAGVRKALMAADEGGHHAYEHLVNGEIYCVSGDGSGDLSAKPTGSRSILDYVTYQNWMKQ